MNKQEIFDKAARGVLEQGGPSIDEDGCMYRAPNGRKCAAGHLIADEHYNPRCENGVVDPQEYGTGYAARCVRKALIASGVPPELHLFVRSLQKAHDEVSTNASFMSDWTSRMRDIAAAHGLNTEVFA